MLIRITERCTMQCTHCMVNAHPDGQHMTAEVFSRALEFCRIDVPVLMISGGEPTEHPQLVEFLKLAVDAGYTPILLSNGEFFTQKPGLAKEVKPLVLGVQVTNDSRFYPRRVELPEGQACESHIRCVSPFGRAKRNGLDTERMSPLCFNLRSATRYFGGIKVGISYLRGTGRMCTPSINYDGSVAAGESPECSSIGTVRSTDEELTEAVLSLSCDRCGLLKFLDQRHRAAIGKS